MGLFPDYLTNKNMGLFDFLKPKKSPLDILMQDPALRGALIEQELEYLHKQVANLRIVGRKEDSKQAIREFLTKYIKDSKGEGVSRLDLARISYSLAYRFLPGLVHSEWSVFCDLWSSGVPFPVYLAITGACRMNKSVSMEQIQEFKYYQGELPSGLKYFLIEFPPPPDTSEGPSIESMMAEIEKGKGISEANKPVLGPHFCAAIPDPFNDKDRHLYILGQSPNGGTTLRKVDKTYSNANHGPGPKPSASGFLKAVESDMLGK